MKKTNLVRNQNILFNDSDLAKILNNFFSNVIKLLSISQSYCEVFMEEIRCDPRILEIREKYLSNKYFTFSQVSYEEALN